MQATDCIIRRIATSDQGTLGFLYFQNFTCNILELPWRLNLPSISCIPEGKYTMVWSRSPRLKRFTYEILNVKNRGGIRLHGGNYAGDVSKGYSSHSLGCPLFGRYHGSDPQLRLYRSRDAVMEFQSLAAGRRMTLLIINDTAKIGAAQ